MLHIIKSAKVNFMKVATPLFVITWAVSLSCRSATGFTRGKKLFGVDFLGGDSTTFSFAQKVDVEKSVPP
jgi:SecD/SecF fusion protein